MKIAAVLAASTLLCLANAFAAGAPPDVLRSKGCLNCHAVDAKRVGPAFKDIAAKYNDNQHALEDLSAKLKSGKGHPKVSASDEDVKSALTWVLGQK
ncbi:MAG: c-type cytochrome [Rhodospirillaceae bacterium]